MWLAARTRLPEYLAIPACIRRHNLLPRILFLFSREIRSCLHRPRNWRPLVRQQQPWPTSSEWRGHMHTAFVSPGCSHLTRHVRTRGTITTARRSERHHHLALVAAVVANFSGQLRGRDWRRVESRSPVLIEQGLQ